FTMSSATSGSSLPSGLAVLTTFPDVLFIPEIIFGGLVWILVASSRVPTPMLQGWVMFVSVFCFVMSITLLFLYICGVHGGSSSWGTVVSGCDRLQSPLCLVSLIDGSLLYCHFIANCRWGLGSFPPPPFTFCTTLMYVIHKVFSLRRWKSS
ncbi:MAL protein, partial [Urocolius indicus]|nr:MAL protein [Urocolius indicus]